MVLDLEYGNDIYVKYTNYCKQIVTNNILFQTFRRYPDYTYMLEHVTYKQGEEYLEQILEKYSEYINKEILEDVQKNDNIGSPIKYNYTINNMVYSLSPTTLRYLYIALDSLNSVKNKELEIVEIGGGYGGQCRLIYILAPIFNITVKNYTILDLYYPNLVQKKYLEKFNINITATTIDKFNSNRVDLLISNYALSEIDSKYQDCYIDIINTSKFGYMLWNRPNIMESIKNKNPIIENEVPLTGKGNVLIKY